MFKQVRGKTTTSRNRGVIAAKLLVAWYLAAIVITVGIKINYHLLTSIYVTSILSYTVLEDDANDEK
ncbi:XXYS1_4_G0033670.mRNA.1.CDS.1 [Saccharomyces cerevisiae]|nr:XXYS1_4_G0033670.mRNA.1.CDS.1 [Saccharomyces cerevisiae]